MSANWYKLAQREYPYYIAVVWAGRYKGMYPEAIKYIPSMKRQWDRGGLGTGKKIAAEITGTNPVEIIDELRARHGITNGDDVDFYVVEAPNTSRRRLHYQEFMHRQKNPN